MAGSSAGAHWPAHVASTEGALQEVWEEASRVRYFVVISLFKIIFVYASSLLTG